MRHAEDEVKVANRQQFLSLVGQTSCFGTAGSVTLVGVSPDQLQASDFKFA